MYKHSKATRKPGAVMKQMAILLEAAETTSCTYRGRGLPVAQAILRGLCLMCKGKQTSVISLSSSPVLSLHSVCKTDSARGKTETGRVDATSTIPELP